MKLAAQDAILMAPSCASRSSTATIVVRFACVHLMLAFLVSALCYKPLHQPYFVSAHTNHSTAVSGAEWSWLCTLMCTRFTVCATRAAMTMVAALASAPHKIRTPQHGQCA